MRSDTNEKARLSNKFFLRRFAEKRNTSFISLYSVERGMKKG